MPDMKPAPIKPTVSKADLEKLDIRVGTIRSVEDVPLSDKLVRLGVDFGDHARTILVGMKGERADVRESYRWETVLSRYRGLMEAVAG
jgi:tRNA-binding protein